MNWTRSSMVSLFVAAVMLGGVAKLAHSDLMPDNCGVPARLDPQNDTVVRGVVVASSLDDRQTAEDLLSFGYLLGARIAFTNALNRLGLQYRCSEVCGGESPVVEGQSLYLDRFDSVDCRSIDLETSYCVIAGLPTPGASLRCNLPDTPPGGLYNP